MEKVSYALGLSIGNNLLSSGIRDLNVEKFTQAIQDVLGGVQPEMNYEEAKATLDKFFRDLADKINAQNIQVGKEFLENNAKKEGVVCLPSGLQYQVLQVGTGKKPGATDKVRCHYEGRLVDGTLFDSSIQRGEPAVFGVNQVIAGWVEALQLMSEGDKWKLCIPYNLGYGEQGAGGAIPPYSTLVFEVELLEVL
jgi:FKBP-type peptidyl-prolyl cis-trans isomerase FklB